MSINDYVAGAFGGAAGLIVGHPFDTTKVQMQTSQTSQPYSGVRDAMSNIRRHGMSGGFFRGLGFPLASYGLVNSVFFGVYSNTGQWLLAGETRSPRQAEIALAAACGGACQLMVACPVDVVKVVLQSQISRTKDTTHRRSFSRLYFRGPTHCLQTLYKDGGLKLCYKGFRIMFIRDIPASVLYFLIYDNLKTTIMSQGMSDSRGIFADIISGGLAGCLSWAAIMPLDVIKSELQADFEGKKYSGIKDCMRKLHTSKGFRAFFVGFVPCMLRAFPANAAIFVAYTQSLSVLQHIQSSFPT